MLSQKFFPTGSHYWLLKFDGRYNHPVVWTRWKWMLCNLSMVLCIGSNFTYFLVDCFLVAVVLNIHMVMMIPSISSTQVFIILQAHHDNIEVISDRWLIKGVTSRSKGHFYGPYYFINEHHCTPSPHKKISLEHTSYTLNKVMSLHDNSLTFILWRLDTDTCIDMNTGYGYTALHFWNFRAWIRIQIWQSWFFYLDCFWNNEIIILTKFFYFFLLRSKKIMELVVSK